MNDPDLPATLAAADALIALLESPAYARHVGGRISVEALSRFAADTLHQRAEPALLAERAAAFRALSALRGHIAADLQNLLGIIAKERGLSESQSRHYITPRQPAAATPARQTSIFGPDPVIPRS